LKPEESILKTLVYFDIFNYPVTRGEIRLFIDQPLSVEEIDTSLVQLLLQRNIYQLDEFISLQNNYSLVERRRKGNQQAAILLNKSRKISKLLYNFPYIRGIGVSGSVSKNFADENADIDYFIITKADRLWVARTILHLFKKIPFLRGRNQWYCMNYFVDEAVLQIEEKNIYTATELITQKPMHGAESINNFFSANEWAFAYFPNFHFSNIDKSSKSSSHPIKKIIEFIFNTKMGNWLDDYFFRLTTKRWLLKEKQGKLNTKGESMGLKTSKHCSKPNPVFFHDQFLEKYESRLKKEMIKWEI